MKRKANTIIIKYDNKKRKKEVYIPETNPICDSICSFNNIANLTVSDLWNMNEIIADNRILDSRLDIYDLVSILVFFSYNIILTDDYIISNNEYNNFIIYYNRYYWMNIKDGSLYLNDDISDEIINIFASRLNQKLNNYKKIYTNINTDPNDDSSINSMILFMLKYKGVTVDNLNNVSYYIHQKIENYLKEKLNIINIIKTRSTYGNILFDEDTLNKYSQATTDLCNRICVGKMLDDEELIFLLHYLSDNLKYVIDPILHNINEI